MGGCQGGFSRYLLRRWLRRRSPLTGIPQKETKWCGRGVVWTMWTTEEGFSSKTKEIWNTRCPESFLALLEGSSWNQ